MQPLNSMIDFFFVQVCLGKIIICIIIFLLNNYTNNYLYSYLVWAFICYVLNFNLHVTHVLTVQYGWYMYIEFTFNNFHVAFICMVELDWLLLHIHELMPCLIYNTFTYILSGRGSS